MTNQSWAQADATNHMPLKFINKIEVFAGPSLNFNYGNKFIENYEDESVENMRKTKVGYVFGVGAYHPLKDWLDLNLRIIYEQKGTNSQMNTHDLKIDTNYKYQYLTLTISPMIFIGKSKKFALSVGGYYGIILSAKGSVDVLDTQNQATFFSNFYGRQIRELRTDGSTSSITFAPGLKSFEGNEFGLVFSFGYSIKINSTNQLMIQLQDNLGLTSINKQLDVIVNPTERNHSVSLLIGYSLNWSSKK